jgi:hypothetical protein
MKTDQLFHSFFPLLRSPNPARPLPSPTWERGGNKL